MNHATQNKDENLHCVDPSSVIILILRLFLLGPTDLSVKKLPSSKTQLSPTEVANIRQLITSYRESAAFLYRSADELEQMLLQLNW